MKHPSSLQDMTKILVSTALGKEKADLVVKNSNLVNVYTGELLEGIDVAVKADRIALLGKADHTVGPNTLILDASDKYLVPGFLDGHMHIEDTMVTVTQFARAVLPRGTTGVFTDLHEIASVLGLEGVRMVLEESRPLPLRVFLGIPSGIPASSPQFETAGAEMGPDDVREALKWEGVYGLGEVGNYPGVLTGDAEVHDKIQSTLRVGKVVDGHAASLLDDKLAAYAAAGIRSCHESTRKIDGLQRARLGIYTMIRESSISYDLANVIKVYTEQKIDSKRLILVTDDPHAEDLLGKGHMDHVIRRAIEEGVDPITAIQMATLNTAEHFQVDKDIGGIAPSKYADIVLLDNLSKVRVNEVIVGGKIISKRGKLIADLRQSEYPERAKKTINVKRRLNPKDFSIKAKQDKVRAHIISVTEGEVVTKHLIEELQTINGEIAQNAEKDIAKVAVADRHKATGNIGLGLVKGFGLKAGAVASTVAHDSHNLLVVGMNDSDMAFAANKLIEIGGGMVAVNQGKVLALVELPIAGLMSDKKVEEVGEELKLLKGAWAELGCKMTSPFITMSFLPLSVIPELRTTDKGLIDTKEFKRIDIVAE